MSYQHIIIVTHLNINSPFTDIEVQVPCRECVVGRVTSLVMKTISPCTPSTIHCSHVMNYSASRLVVDDSRDAGVDKC